MTKLTLNIKGFGNYIRAIEKGLGRGISTELSYYSFLKELLESLGNDVTVISNPQRIECGAPDFIVSKGSATIGYIEAKDIGKTTQLSEVRNDV